jgi:hypothetical protein
MCQQQKPTKPAVPKPAVPTTPEKYFQQTEYAVRLAYSGLHECGDYFREAVKLMRPPVNREGMYWYLPAETPEEKERDARVGELFAKFAELRPSEAMLAGSILQAAFMAIAIFSKNSSVPPKYGPLARKPVGERVG